MILLLYEALRDLLSEWTSLNTMVYQRDISFSCVITNYSHMNILLLLFYHFYVSFVFIVLLLLLCHVCYCDACKCLHGLGICVSLNQINWWWWWWTVKGCLPDSGTCRTFIFTAWEVFMLRWYFSRSTQPPPSHWGRQIQYRPAWLGLRGGIFTYLVAGNTVMPYDAS